MQPGAAPNTQDAPDAAHNTQDALDAVPNTQDAPDISEGSPLYRFLTLVTWVTTDFKLLNLLQVGYY